MLSSSRWIVAVLLGVIGVSIFGCKIERKEVREDPDREIIIERRS